jgi:hypothetical protein
MNPEQISRLPETSLDPVNLPSLQTAPVMPVNVKSVQPSLIPGTRYSFPLPSLPNLTVKATFVEGVNPSNKNKPYQYMFKDVKMYNNQSGIMVGQQPFYFLSYTGNFPQNIIAIDGVSNIGGRLKKNRRSKSRTKKSKRRYSRKRKSRRFHRL